MFRSRTMPMNVAAGLATVVSIDTDITCSRQPTWVSSSPVMLECEDESHSTTVNKILKPIKRSMPILACVLAYSLQVTTARKNRATIDAMKAPMDLQPILEQGALYFVKSSLRLLNDPFLERLDCSSSDFQIPAQSTFNTVHLLRSQYAMLAIHLRN
jgi:hypothetical protein